MNQETDQEKELINEALLVINYLTARINGLQEHHYNGLADAQDELMKQMRMGQRAAFKEVKLWFQRRFKLIAQHTGTIRNRKDPHANL